MPAITVDVTNAAAANDIEVMKKKPEKYKPCQDKTCPGVPTRSDTNRALQPQDLGSRGIILSQ